MCVCVGVGVGVLGGEGDSRTLVGEFEQRLGVLLIMCAFLAFGSLSSLEVCACARLSLSCACVRLSALRVHGENL